MGWTLRPGTAVDVADMVTAVWAPFGNRPTDTQIEETEAFLELDRTVVAVDSDQVVGAAGMLSLELTVPGPATVAAGGLTQVGVRPTHRRQGILTALIARMHDDARHRGEFVAALLAAEATIYGRFGYGVAVTSCSVDIQRAHAALRRPVDIAGRARMLEPAEMAQTLPVVHDRYRRAQPGEVSRSQSWWQRRLADRDHHRGGAGARLAALWDGGEGYVTYRVRPRWDDGLPGHDLEIEDLVAVTAEARAGLWQFCFGVDLIGVLKAGNVPVDEPLRWMLVDGRRLRVTSVRDVLWVRLLDVEGALSARSYGSGHALVLDVADPSSEATAGRYRLEEGICRRTDRMADLRLDVADLSAAYLGGVRFTTLARAGLVSELTPGALRRADTLFAADPVPYCCTGF